MVELKRKDLVYADLSYTIIGALYDVYNILGPGHHEKNYQKAITEELIRREIQFNREFRVPLIYKDKIIGNNYLDFIIENKVILEIKKGDKFSKRHIDQVLNYLKLSQMRLAILANFSSNGIIFKRLVNIT